MWKNHVFSKGLVAGVALLFLTLSAASSLPVEASAGDELRVIEETAQTDNGTLSGYVTDYLHTPIAGARVRVCYHGDHSENFSDETGYYHVTNIPLCMCLKNATSSKEGYVSKTVDNLSISEDTVYDFILYPESSDSSLSVGAISGSICRIKFKMTNTGPCSATDIHWTISFASQMPMQTFASGEISSLDAGASKTIGRFRPVSFGIGPCTIMVEAYSSSCGYCEHYATAYAFFVFIIAIQNQGK